PELEHAVGDVERDAIVREAVAQLALHPIEEREVVGRRRGRRSVFEPLDHALLVARRAITLTSELPALLGDLVAQPRAAAPAGVAAQDVHAARTPCAPQDAPAASPTRSARHDNSSRRDSPPRYARSARTGTRSHRRIRLARCVCSRGWYSSRRWLRAFRVEP